MDRRGGKLAVVQRHGNFARRAKAEFAQMRPGTGVCNVCVMGEMMPLLDVWF